MNETEPLSSGRPRRDPATIVVDITAAIVKAAAGLRDLCEVLGIDRPLIVTAPPTKEKVFPERTPGPAPAPKPPNKILHELDGKKRSVTELAAMAGCSYITMYCRLKTRTPAEAVSMGGASPISRGRAPTAPTAKPDAVAAPAAASPLRVSIAEEQKAKATRVNLEQKLSANAEVIVPDDVVRIVAPTPPDRFAPDPATVVPTFSNLKPGQYEPGSSAIARAQRARDLTKGTL